jgi:hypothetical protein
MPCSALHQKTLSGALAKQEKAVILVRIKSEALF